MDVAVSADGPATRLNHPEFPLSSKYGDAWQLQEHMGPNPLWFVELVSEKCPIEPGIRVLDLACGAGLTSIFLAREFAAEVWAVDMKLNRAAVHGRLRESGLTEQVNLVEADARELPFAYESFDVIICVNAYYLFGSDDSYLPYVSQFLRPGGRLGVTQVGFDDDPAPGTPRRSPGYYWDGQVVKARPLDWWKETWNACDDVVVEVAEAVPNAWENWLRWNEICLEEGAVQLRRELEAETEYLRADGGDHFGFHRLVARKAITRR